MCKLANGFGTQQTLQNPLKRGFLVLNQFSSLNSGLVVLRLYVKAWGHVLTYEYALYSKIHSCIMNWRGDSCLTYISLSSFPCWARNLLLPVQVT